MDIRFWEDYSSAANFNFLTDTQSNQEPFFKLESSKNHSEEDCSEHNLLPLEEFNQESATSGEFDGYRLKINADAESSVEEPMKKRDIKWIVKGSSKSKSVVKDVKIEKRKRQNREAAQKSRDRKKQKINMIENDKLYYKNELERVRKVLDSYVEQLHIVNSDINEVLWDNCILNFRQKALHRSEHYEMNSEIRKNNELTLEKTPDTSYLKRSSSNITKASFHLSSSNTSEPDIELESQVCSQNTPNGEFKAPTPKKKQAAAISIVLGSNIPLNIFSIFSSVFMVACFMWLWFITSEDVQPETHSEFESRRHLNEIPENISFNTSDDKAYNNYSSDDIHTESYNIHSNPKNFLEFVKHQRFSFFSKVEDDYIDDPENLTLQVFKPDEEVDENKGFFHIQQKLYNTNYMNDRQLKTSQEYVDQKNEKYNKIESLLCDSSVLYSEDLKFLFEDDLNYLHLLIRTKGIEVVSSQYESGHKHQDKSSKTDQNDLIEIGWKVFSVTQMDMQD